MDQKKRSRRPDHPPRPDRATKPKPTRTTLSVRKVRGQDAWELVHPPCALDRVEDVKEVEAMLDAGETDLAREELRWLLDECRDLLDAHRLLGEIALFEGDIKLARAHFGYAYKIAADALPTEDSSFGPLPYSLPANQGFFQAGKGLAFCLKQLDRADLARDVLTHLISLDPIDPLSLAALLPPPSPSAKGL